MSCAVRLSLPLGCQPRNPSDTLPMSNPSAYGWNSIQSARQPDSTVHKKQFNDQHCGWFVVPVNCDVNSNCPWSSSNSVEVFPDPYHLEYAEWNQRIWRLLYCLFPTFQASVLHLAVQSDALLKLQVVYLFWGVAIDLIITKLGRDVAFACSSICSFGKHSCLVQIKYLQFGCRQFRMDS